LFFKTQFRGGGVLKTLGQEVGGGVKRGWGKGVGCF